MKLLFGISDDWAKQPDVRQKRWNELFDSAERVISEVAETLPDEIRQENADIKTKQFLQQRDRQDMKNAGAVQPHHDWYEQQ